MTDTDPQQADRQQENELRAAEYVLGLLSDLETRAFQREMRAHPALRGLVAGWQRDLGGIGLGIVLGPTPVAPAPSVWTALVARLGLEPGRAALAVWRSLAVAASVVAAVLGVLLAVALSGPPSQIQYPTYASLIRDETHGVGWLVTAGEDKSEITITALGDYYFDREKSLELWLLPPGGDPVSLGLVPEEGERHITLPKPKQLALSERATMAVSLEPPGGSPVGRPTGQTISIAPVTAELDRYQIGGPLGAGGL